jgi:O-antigen/teichoic acid export membrane protein
VLLGGGAVGALVGRASAYAFGCALALVLAGRHVGSWTRQLRRRSAGQVRAIAGYATALALVEGSWIVFTKIDGLLIGGFLNAAQVGFFQAPIRLAAIISYPGYALAIGVAPTLARPQSTRPEAFTRALRYIAIVQVTLLVPCVVWAEPIVRVLLGAQFAASATVRRRALRVPLGFAPLLSIAVDYLGDARKRIPIAIATVAINVILTSFSFRELGSSVPRSARTSPSPSTFRHAFTAPAVEARPSLLAGRWLGLLSPHLPRPRFWPPSLSRACRSPMGSRAERLE